MRYTKPAVLSCSMASSSVMGSPKATRNPDNIEGGMPAFLSSVGAYEADE
jgi:hypothetical protein